MTHIFHFSLCFFDVHVIWGLLISVEHMHIFYCNMWTVKQIEIALHYIQWHSLSLFFTLFEAFFLKTFFCCWFLLHEILRISFDQWEWGEGGFGINICCNLHKSTTKETSEIIRSILIITKAAPFCHHRQKTSNRHLNKIHFILLLIFGKKFLV